LNTTKWQLGRGIIGRKKTWPDWVLRTTKPKIKQGSGLFRALSFIHRLAKTYGNVHRCLTVKFKFVKQISRAAVNPADLFILF